MITKNTTNWLSKSFKCAQYKDYPSDSSEKEEKPIRHFVQWMTSDNKFFAPASSVVKILPPGYYRIEQSMQGLFFCKQDAWKEKLIKFPETSSDVVVAEIEKFWDKESEFREMKLAYRRGILLYGPPGSGKSSVMKLAIRNLIKRDGVVLDFGHPSSFKAGMELLREVQPDTPVIVLMEDIDSILDSFRESEVLNLLDGVVPMDKTIFVATTNYPEKLSSRIMNRPSRFDKRFEIGMPNDESRRIYLSSIASDLSGEQLDKWVTDTEGLSIAHLKELVVSVNILDYKYDDAIASLKGLKTKVYSEEYKETHMPMAIVKAVGDPA